MSESSGAATVAGWSVAAGKDRRRFRWSTLLWALIYPPRGHRIAPTVTGLVLIGLSLGIGVAAYNSASNILFITLSLLLGCLILSGVLSWLNFRGTDWRLDLAPALRAGQETTVALEVRNEKGWLPTYGLWFELSARPALAPVAPESTVTGRDLDFKAAWRRAGATDGRTTLHQRERLGPGETLRLEWVFSPPRRGRERIELTGVGSLYPFGFLKKNLGGDLRREVLVWPAAAAYQAWPAGGAAHLAQGERVARAGGGADLLALRKYQTGDSHRLIHWKASARLRQPMVRQFAAEAEARFFLQLETPAPVWRQPEQFELLCSFAAALAEDLFTAGQLAGAAVNGGEPILMRRVRDVETLLDQLAELEVVDLGGKDVGGVPSPREIVPMRGEGTPPTKTNTARPSRSAGIGRSDLVTFRPEGTRGVCAYVDGHKIAAA